MVDRWRFDARKRVFQRSRYNECPVICESRILSVLLRSEFIVQAARLDDRIKEDAHIIRIEPLQPLTEEITMRIRWISLALPGLIVLLISTACAEAPPGVNEALENQTA